MPDTPQTPHTNTANAGGEREALAQEISARWVTIDLSKARGLADFILERIQAAQTIEAKKHEDIYKWLLGEAGDFPVSEPGKRYGWRIELRQRLAHLKEKGQSNG